MMTSISRLVGWFSAKLGTCAHCTRLARRTALASWLATGLVIVFFPVPIVIIGICLVATALTALWIAHVARARSRKTLAGTLRQFGATRQDARAIVAAFGPHDKNLGLREGETLRVQFAPAAAGDGRRPSRIVVAGPERVVAAVALSSRGIYVPLDPRDIEAEPAG